MEVATAAAPAASAPPASAGATLTSVPAAAPPPSAPSSAAPTGATVTWFDSFKNPELKSYISQKNFSDPEKLAESYQNLEKFKGVPEDRLLRLPEKFEGDEAKAVFQRLGMPKDAKEYELPRDEKSQDPGFADWAESAFIKNNLTKSQAQGLAKAYSERMALDAQASAEKRSLALIHADETLKKEWGPHYDTNLNVVRQGAKILGLDARSLDLMEAINGRESLFKTLHKIGVGVGESKFVDGGLPPADPTPEQAQARIKEMMGDQKFIKKVNRGDQEALAEWNKVNKLAAPGEKIIG